GRFPDSESELRELPGIGPYTGAAVAAIAFDQPAAVLDGNIERVKARLFAVTAPLPGAKPQLRALAGELTPARRPGCHAQALMDLGATICTPRRPACAICPLRPACRAVSEGIADSLPRKAEKPVKPVRRGIAWAAFDEAGRVWVVRRPPKGLLGGMLALPTSDWTATEASPSLHAPVAAAWQPVGEVRHTFTHFHLRLGVMRAIVTPLPGEARAVAEAGEAMPTVFAKALRLAAR
ncbi:MAG: NUDIX domain-containing protein, partial [Pikeienuella sp.]